MHELLNRKTRREVRESEAARTQPDVRGGSFPSGTVEQAATEPVVTMPGDPPMDSYEFAGLPIVVENKKGSIRAWGKDQITGKILGSLMHFDYGYIDGSVGADGDEVDVYIGPVANPEWVFVVHQNEPESGVYDEDKALIGFPDAESARQAYLQQYDDPRFFGGMSQMSLEDFYTKLDGRENLKITNSVVSKTMTPDDAVAGEIGGLDDEDLKSLANEVAELWATLYGSALNSAKQEISDQQLEMSEPEIQALRDRRKRSVLHDSLLPASKLYMVVRDGKAHGLLSMGAGRELGVEEFMSQDMAEQHDVDSDALRQRWPDVNRLFLHDVLAYLDFGEPMSPEDVEYKAVFKMTREDLVKLAERLWLEAARRKIDLGLPHDLLRRMGIEKGEDSHGPGSPGELYMPPNDPNPELDPDVAKPPEYRSNGKPTPGVSEPLDGPKGHEWGSNNPSQQEWDAGDYSHYGEGDAGGFYEFSLSGGARYVPKVSPATSDGLVAGGKRNPVIARWRSTLTKAAVVPTVRMLLEARVHESFTITADHLFALGLMEREERILLSGLIGKLLTEFGDEIPYDLGSRPLSAAAEVEDRVVEKTDDQPPDGVDEKTPPDIITAETPLSGPPGPAAASPQWGPDPQPAVAMRNVDEQVSKAANDDFIVRQRGEERYPFVLQHHFRGIWSPAERSELRAGLQKVKELAAKDQAAADRLLAKIWRAYKPEVLTTSLEKFSSAVQAAADENGSVSSVAAKNLDGSIPRTLDLQRIFPSIVNRGSVHTDLRVKSPEGDWLIGWTMDTPGIVLQTLDGKLLRVLRSKVVENQPGDKILCQQKGRMDEAWLKLVSPGKSVHRVQPGGVGATKLTSAEFRFVDSGQVIFGVQRPDYHELFLSFEKNKKLDGRWELREVKEPGAKGAERYWLADRPRDQEPFAVSHEQDSERHAVPTTVWNESAIEALRASGYRDLGEETVRKFVEVLKDVGEERTVFGVVLTPETVDAHGDVISVDEVRNAAYTYMEYFQHKGFQHGKSPRYPAFPEGLRLLESYVLDPQLFPEGLKVGGRHIKPGTWLMRMRVDHDGLWSDVKSGRITGFSIGGFARSMVERRAA